MNNEELKETGNDIDEAGNFIQPEQSISDIEFKMNSETQLAPEQKETQPRRVEILDTSGRVLCDLNRDPETGRIATIYPKPYKNIGELAENVDERICVTDPEGNVTDERLTRAEAREAKKRYLIVTTLIFHNNRVLVQK